MQMTINGALSSTRFTAGLFTLAAVTPDGTSSQPTVPSPSTDRVELSDQALALQKMPETESSAEEPGTTATDRFRDFVTNILAGLTNSSVTTLPPTNTPTDTSVSDTATPAVEQSLSVQQASISGESTALSIDGTIDTADGEHLSFALNLQLFHAQISSQAVELQQGANGLALSYSGTAAELTSTSFSFALSSSGEPDSPKGHGIGTFSLKDELKEARQAIKPMAKELFKEAGMPSGWSTVNRLLQAVA
jgi:hypothetical protein